jgi:hypothetical protein
MFESKENCITKTALHNDPTGNLLDSNVGIHLYIHLILLLAQEKNVFI